MLCMGLFFVGILARAIAMLGFDSRPALPTPFVVNRDIVSFVYFWVGHLRPSTMAGSLADQHNLLGLASSYLSSGYDAHLAGYWGRSYQCNR